MSTINIDTYNATTQAVTDAIRRSVSHDETVILTSRKQSNADSVAAELADMCDDWTDANDGVREYWGSYDDMDGQKQDWRIHVVMVEMEERANKGEGAMLRIRNNQTGEVESISRDVRHTHSDWVHAQCGTESESELQDMLSQMSLSEFAANPDSEDSCGIFMTAASAAEYLGE